jgi:hypothetical protein
MPPPCPQTVQGRECQSLLSKGHGLLCSTLLTGFGKARSKPPPARQAVTQSYCPALTMPPPHAQIAQGRTYHLLSNRGHGLLLSTASENAPRRILWPLSGCGTVKLFGTKPLVFSLPPPRLEVPQTRQKRPSTVQQGPWVAAQHTLEEWARATLSPCQAVAQSYCLALSLWSSLSPYLHLKSHYEE